MTPYLMKAAFLDFATVGSDEIDDSPLRELTDELHVYDNTPAEEVVSRIDGVDIVIASEGCAPLGKGGARRGACAKAAKRVAREQASVSRGSRAVSRGLRGAADRQAGRRLR